MALRTIKTGLTALDTRRVKLPPKQADDFYQTAEYRRWRTIVVNRAGGQCEAMTAEGRRCRRAAPHDRMFADHKIEIKDGGAPLDPENGQCLCGSHHSRKTAQMRAARR